MTCRQCKSTNVKIEMVTKTKHRGFFGWMWWLFLIICSGGLLLIIPLITNTKSKMVKMAVCQDCGHSWKIR